MKKYKAKLKRWRCGTFKDTEYVGLLICFAMIGLYTYSAYTAGTFLPSGWAIMLIGAFTAIGMVLKVPETSATDSDL